MSSRREINGNNTTTPVHTAKRKTNHHRNGENNRRQHTPGGPVHFKHSQSSPYNFDPILNLPCYPHNNQNMFPAISDPSLCYPIMNYPYEPHSLPNYNPYQPMYRNACPPNYFKTQLMPEPPTNYFKGHTHAPVQDSEEFASLPVVNGAPQNDNKRRFSDPGDMANECEDSADDSTKNEVVQCLIEQVNYLKESNRRLYRELHEMRNEMNFLKQQFGIRFYDKEYEPGMLSDVVREIRDAARIREETLLSKVKHEVKNMIEERQMTVNHLQLVAEKTRNSDRLGKLEEQMKSLCLSNTNNNNRSLREGTPDDTSSTDQVLELEQVNLELRRELQEARAGKKDADAKIIHLDQMLSSYHHQHQHQQHPYQNLNQQKYVNGGGDTTSVSLSAASAPSIIDDAKTTSSSIDNCSLATAASPVARVVMSGPVTSL